MRNKNSTNIFIKFFKSKPFFYICSDSKSSISKKMFIYAQQGTLQIFDIFLLNLTIQIEQKTIFFSHSVILLFSQ